MKTIRLTQGKVAMVDEEDYERIAVHKWSAVLENNGVWYAVRNERTATGRRVVPMHREILGTPVGSDTDHVDGDGLNNQRANLRVATRRQNKMNGRAYKGGTSAYKGVSACFGRWKAQIQVSGRRTHLGLFDDEAAAAKAYDAAARQHYGEFARLNFPREGERCALVTASA